MTPDNSTPSPAGEPPAHAYDPRLDPRGSPQGPVDFTIRTQRESAAWRKLAAEHASAKEALNALLPDRLPWKRTPEGVERLSDRRTANDAAVRAARERYKAACCAFFDLPNLRPRHLPTLIRCAAELAQAGDPVWSNASFGQARDRADFAWCALFRTSERVLRSAGEEC